MTLQAARTRMRIEPDGRRVYNLNHQFGIFPPETEFQNILL